MTKLSGMIYEELCFRPDGITRTIDSLDFDFKREISSRHTINKVFFRRRPRFWVHNFCWKFVGWLKDTVGVHVRLLVLHGRLLGHTPPPLCGWTQKIGWGEWGRWLGAKEEERVLISWWKSGQEFPKSVQMMSTEIGKKARLFAKLQPGRARKRINAT